MTEARPLAEATGPPAVAAPSAYRWSVVPHTHWDREWYLPFEHFRIRLARTVDEVIDVLERDPNFAHFVLDGQAVILEDYLEVRPEREERLRALIADRRIAIGPAYTLPDEFLVSGESLVRNLLHGRFVCRRFGAEPMPVGYLPDTFGHVGQLPQILRGFGLDTFVFWRGLGDEGRRLGAVFSWVAPDGSRVTAVRQLGSYGSAAQLGRWGRDGRDHLGEDATYPTAAADRFVRFLERYADELRVTGHRTLLLCNGSDHEPIHRPLPALVAHARSAHPGAEIAIETYEGYVSALRQELGERAEPLPEWTGELCAGRDAPVLRGINSARIYLKQANERSERALFVAETLASLAVLRGTYTYPLNELRVAWRELLRNQPHDSVSGCSVDEVHRDMAGRYRTVASIAERVRREALSALAGEVEAWSYRPRPIDSMSIVNPLPFARRRLVEIPVPPWLAAADDLVLEDEHGPMELQLERSSDGITAAWTVADVPGWGATPASLREAALAGDVAVRTVADRVRVVDERTIENKRYTVRASPSGEIAVTEHGSGRTWRGLHRFVDVADRGDEYNFCPLEGDEAWVASGVGGSVRVLRAGPVVAELEVRFVALLPEALEPHRQARSASEVRCEVRSVVRLVAGGERIEFETAVDNAARDHRLRVHFRVPEGGDRVRAEGHFALVERPARMTWSSEGWAEPPADTHHFGGALAAADFALFSLGMPEYEAIPGPDGELDVALTLLRCVGWLSRDDLATRPGGAGPSLETPEAQCIGEHRFAYAISLGGHNDVVALLRASQDYRVGLEVGPAWGEARPPLRLDGDVVVTALKAAEGGDGVVLRAFNPGATDASVSIGRASVERVRLDEAEAAPGGATVRRGEIATFRLRPSA